MLTFFVVLAIGAPLMVAIHWAMQAGHSPKGRPGRSGHSNCDGGFGGRRSG